MISSPEARDGHHISERFARFHQLGDLLEEVREETTRGIYFIPSSDTRNFVSYADLYENAIASLGALQRQGVGPGCKMVFQLADEQQFVTIFWACILGGIVPVPVTLGYHEEFRIKLSLIIREMDEPFLLTDEKTLTSLHKFFVADHHDGEFEYLKSKSITLEALEKVAEPGRTAPNKASDLAFIQYSSGSTGSPKGVMLTHENLLTNLLAILEGSQISDSDLSLSWMPLTHDMGLIGLHLSPLAAGISHCIMPPALFIRKPMIWLDAACQYGATVLASPNFGYRHFLVHYRNKDIQEWDLSRIRLIYNGAEPISGKLCDEFTNALQPYGLKRNVIFPVYGMAEASLAVTFSDPEDAVTSVTIDHNLASFESVENLNHGHTREGSSFVLLGKPVKGCEVRICNQDGVPVAEDVIGLIQIRGGNVTSGYYRNPSATKAAFTDDGWLRTGDLGFVRDGKLVCTGRVKDIIFRLGQNYYSHDLERVAAELPGIEPDRIAICGIYEANHEECRVVAFVRYRRKLDKFAVVAQELKKYMGKHMGLELEAVVPVRKLPRTTSGKLQRYILENHYRKGMYDRNLRELKSKLKALERDRQVEAPKNDTQIKLAELWMLVLGVEHVGLEDNFFELGGDSLKASDLAIHVGMVFHIRIALRDIFANQTLREMAAQIAGTETFHFERIVPIEKRPHYPLSSEQQRLFFLYQLDKTNVGYNTCQGVEIIGALDKVALTRAFENLVVRHDILRAGFQSEMGRPSQTIYNDVEVTIPVIDAADANPREILDTLIQPFDLTQPPLWRVTLLETGPERHILFLEIHHIICDGTSIALLVGDLLALYEGETLEPLRLQYQDYAVWQNRVMNSEGIEQESLFWQSVLEGELPALNLVPDYPRPSIRDSKGDFYHFQIDAEVTDSLRKLAKAHEATLGMVMLALYKVMLAKYTGQFDLIVGSVLAGRNHAGLERVAGMFVKTVVWRTRFKTDYSFDDMLEEIKHHFLEVYENQDFPFEKIVETFVRDRDLSRNPLFDALFAFQNFPLPDAKIRNLKVQSLPFRPRAARFDLFLEIREEGPMLHCVLEYPTSLFRRDTIEKMALHLNFLAKQVIVNPERPFYQLHMTTEMEKRQILQEFNRPKQPFSKDRVISRFLEDRVQAEPEMEAVFWGDDSLTLSEYNARANRLAHYLVRLGASPEDRVALLIEPSFDLVVACMAVFKAGCSYLPINPADPQSRIEMLLEDADVSILIRQSHLSHPRLDDLKVVVIDSDLRWHDESPNNLKLALRSHLPAYMIFTSGSTGRPKGVVVEHRGVVNLLQYMEQRFPCESDDTWLFKNAYTFDVSVLDLYAWFFGKGRMRIAPKKVDREPLVLHELLVRGRITHALFVPSALALLADACQPEQFKQLHAFKYLIAAGEVLTKQLANRVLEKIPNASLINGYGPTEATVLTTLESVHYLSGKSNPPIGRPVANMAVYILNDSMQLQPTGVPGELYIGGEGVARGYHRREELTCERFVDNPWLTGTKMYRSGDLARWLPDGRIEFLGRIDHQIKIRGFRVELGEIEACMLEFDTVCDGVVTGATLAGQDTRLCAYYTCETEVDVQELRLHMQRNLPEYMLPSFFVRIDQVPRTTSGKINPRALPEPSQSDVIRADYEPPISELDHLVVDIWQEVLGVDRIGLNDHFFEMGGHSLVATRAMEALQKRLDLTLETRLLFESPVVRQLVLRIEEERHKHSHAGSDEDLSLVRSRLGAEIRVFTVAGRPMRLWFSDQAEKDMIAVLAEMGRPDILPHYVLPVNQIEHFPEGRNEEIDYPNLALRLKLSRPEMTFEDWITRFQDQILQTRLDMTASAAYLKPTRNYPCGHHPKWYARSNIRSVVFAEFYGACMLDEALVREGIDLFIEKQSLMRSMLVNEGEDIVFSEYGGLKIGPLKVIDLSGYHREAGFQALDAIREIMRADLVSTPPLNQILFNAALIKLNFSQYRLIFAFDHIIADSECIRVVNYHFDYLNHFRDGKHPFTNYHVEDYETFTRMSALLPERPRLQHFKQTNEYLDYRNHVLNLQKRYGSREAIVFSKPYHLELHIEDWETFDLVPNYMGLGLAISVQTLGELFQIERIPLRVLVNKRIFQGTSFYNTVGDFHDSTPVVFKVGDTTPESCYQTLHRLDQKFSDAGFYISNFGSDPEIFQAVFRSPFNFNYVGKIPPKEEADALRKADVFRFVPYPIFSYLRGLKLGFIFFHGMTPACEQSLRQFLKRMPGSYRLTMLEGND